MRRRCRRQVPAPTVLELPPELPPNLQARITAPFFKPSSMVDLLCSLPQSSQHSHATKTSKQFKFGEIGRPRMGRETNEGSRGEKQHKAPNYRQRLDRGDNESSDAKRSMFLPGIWRGVLLKSVRTLRLPDSHPLALSLGQRFNFGKKERTSVVRSKEEESRVEKAAGSHQLSTLNYSEHLGFVEFGRPRIGKRSQEKESRKLDTPCRTYSSYQSRSWAPGRLLFICP